jgi:RNA polymerase sigma-70 factor, ECF subfamily
MVGAIRGADMEIDEDLAGLAKRAWHLFIERTEPLRPELYRYCRSLTGSVWDGEDLVQDTLMRGFARLSEASHQITNVRAYLFRIASNLWIDKFRRTREVASEESINAIQPEVPDAREIRDAAGRLIGLLPPMERAVVLLKDVFDFTLEEAATALDTSVGGGRLRYIADVRG